MAFAAIGLSTSARALISSLLEFAKREEHDQVAMRKSVANVLPADSPRERAAKLARHRTKGDRKSTRLNSSHSQISYAVFCLKKKIITTIMATIQRINIIGSREGSRNRRRLKANQTGKQFRVGIKSNISINRNNLISGVDRCIHLNAMKKTTITSIIFFFNKTDPRRCILSSPQHRCPR